MLPQIEVCVVIPTYREEIMAPEVKQVGQGCISKFHLRQCELRCELRATEP